VTGASRGIGAATARALAGARARVLLVARDRAALDALARAVGGGAAAVPADLADPAAADAAGRALLAAGGGAPDILVSNAGAFPLAPLDETPPDTFAATVQLNLVAPFRLLAACLGPMRARGHGHVVTIGSVADRVVYPGNGAYAATKFGARALHEVLRAETRGSGIRATLVSPGPVDTALWDPHDPDGRADLPARSAMLATDAVADAVVWAVTRPADVTIEELRLARS
jgi:NADP-dependent 3-hydroxy acid dehydrogenase YdfG